MGRITHWALRSKSLSVSRKSKSRETDGRRVTLGETAGFGSESVCSALSENSSVLSQETLTGGGGCNGNNAM